jgi:hypothetical protein
MKTMTPHETVLLIERFNQLRPESKALWGKMNAGQMVRHLLDSYALAMGERRASEASTWVGRNLLKYLAFYMPMKWPKNVVTRPEMDQELGGTPPGEFHNDLAQLAEVLRRFAASPRDFRFGRHPVFMELTEWEWMRWGWLHADHHLRQFGL